MASLEVWWFCKRGG